MAVGFDVITIFPEVINAYCAESILKRAIERGLVDIKVHNLRDFTTDKHKTVDDYPYGGGSGMVFKIEPVYYALERLKTDGQQRYTVLLSPQGETYTQSLAGEFSREQRRVVLICGRYEGIDERVRENLIDREVSIGDYVLTGGELAALVIIDSAVRLIPGVLGASESAQEDSFARGILDYPHYTRPPDFRGMKVPELLLSGNHGEISRWRRKEAIRKTLLKRPDLLEKVTLDDNDLKIMQELCSQVEIQASKNQED
jgi:tRNA (guanine37-N1)-methyltransferase